MALNPTNFLIQASQLPATFVGDPNAFFRAMVERMRIVSPTGVSTFVISDVQPQSNQGPWLKGGTQWWVWSEDLKTYVPLDISQSETHWFQTGSTIPTVTEPPVWLKTTSGTTQPGTGEGTPVGWYLYNGTAWVGFTELVAKEVTFDKLADGVQGALITYDATNRPVLLAIGNPGDFARVNAAGNAVEYSPADAISLKGLLGAQIFGPLTDTSGYHADQQNVTVNLSENREVLITAYVRFAMNNNQFAILTFSVDGNPQDSFRGDAGTGAYTTSATLTTRMTLAAGPHTLNVTMPGTPATGSLMDPAGNNTQAAVKFIVELL